MDENNNDSSTSILNEEQLRAIQFSLRKQHGNGVAIMDDDEKLDELNKWISSAEPKFIT